MPAPPLRFRLRLPYAQWERAMLAGKLDALRADLAGFALACQPAWDDARDDMEKRFENLLLYGTTHPEIYVVPEPEKAEL